MARVRRLCQCSSRAAQGKYRRPAAQSRAEDVSFYVVGIPHMVNVENGLGSIIINWHIARNVEFKTLPAMKRMGLLRKKVPASFMLRRVIFAITRVMTPALTHAAREGRWWNF